MLVKDIHTAGQYLDDVPEVVHDAGGHQSQRLQSERRATRIKGIGRRAVCWF
jgi:hypothetical protein